MPVRVVSPKNAIDVPTAHDFECPDGSAFRAVPLLSSFDGQDGHLVAVGQVRILAQVRRSAEVDVIVHALWHSRAVGKGEEEWKPIVEHRDLAAGVSAQILAHLGGPHPNPEYAATLLAKRLAEAARDRVSSLRSFRYKLEKSLGDTLRSQQGLDLQRTLANIIEVSAMCSRAGDEAREAVREGLWTWQSDSSAYWAHRQVSDPAVVIERRHRKGRRRSWFIDLDNGVRHCRQMEVLVAQETSLLHSLLNAASTIAVTRDARAQEKFNLLASVGAVLFGLPALIVALYGAADALPVSHANWKILLPVAISGFLASIIAAVLSAGVRQRVVRFCTTFIATLVIIAVLAYAGTLVDPGKAQERNRNQPAPATGR
jgi:hypothetical protein